MLISSMLFRSTRNVLFLGGVTAALVVGCGQGPGESSAVGTESSAFVYNSNIFYDGLNGNATQCLVGGVVMHCCPRGSAMIGARVDQNVFKCAQLVDSSGAITLNPDPGTQRNGMHSCPFGSVMVGLRADHNALACQTIPSDHINFEFVDGNPPTEDGFPMHVCPSPAAMTGIRIDRNLLNCGENLNPIVIP
jgi:hypothetical protein